MPKSRVTYDTVRQLGLKLPNVEEGTSYGTPALKVKGELFVRLHQDLDKIVLRMPFDRREEMIEDDPETYSITDHYRDYPWILVSLAHVRADALPDLLNIAYRVASAGKRAGRVGPRDSRQPGGTNATSWFEAPSHTRRTDAK
jgi:hypothetical protein